jgi:molecular chaperone GrpE
MSDSTNKPDQDSATLGSGEPLAAQSAHTTENLANETDGHGAGQNAQASPESQAANADEPSLGAQLVEAQARATEYHDAFLRAKAEQENIRRRAQEDISKARKFAVEAFAESLVPVIDSLEAALSAEAATPEAMRNGIELTLKQLQSAFEKGHLATLNPAGEKFDPNRHQAISMVPAPEGVLPNHVVTVLQKGYLIADRVLRPALVTVAQG